MSAPQVSVIIPCYNYARFLPDAVASVAAQTFEAWELLIVDDGSSDDTWPVAQHLGEHVPLRLLRQPNGGPSAARNTGARHANAPLLLFLDADDVLAPDALRLMVAALERAPDAAFVSGAFQVFGSDTVHWPGLPVDLATLKLDNTVLPAAMVRRDDWQAADGFDTAIDLYEDWDFWLRLVANGRHSVVLPDTLLYYRRHGTSLMSHAPAHGWSARAYIMRKHPHLYGARLARWAERRLAAQPLPATHYQPANDAAVEIAAVQTPTLGFTRTVALPPPGTPPRGTRRLLRMVPAPLRIQAKKIVRRVQLLARSYEV